MIILHSSSARGHAHHGWLDSRHSFSFGGYHNPERMGWGNLLVINEDKIAPGTGFGSHPHRDMEIVSYVLEGNLAHRDNMGNVKGIPAGDFQRMSAGTGVVHSEFNHAEGQTTHFLQIWIMPKANALPPSYEQKSFSSTDKDGKLVLVGSPTGAHGSLLLGAAAHILNGAFGPGQSAKVDLQGQRAYLHVIKGAIHANSMHMGAGDALMIVDEDNLSLSDGIDSEVLVFLLAD